VNIQASINQWQIGQEEQKLYDHFLNSVKGCSPDEAIENFRILFIKGKAGENPEVYNSLANIVNNKAIENRFQFIINRCCHILINRWQMEPSTQVRIAELIAVFDELVPIFTGVSNTTLRLRQLMIAFTTTDYFVQLKRLQRIIGENQDGKKTIVSVGNLINRYPYLYDYALVSNDGSKEQQQTVKKIKAQLEKQFEVNLSQYVTYQVRMAQTNQYGKSNDRAVSPIIHPVENPTLLTEREVGVALKHFVGTVEGGYTYRDLSQRFVSHLSDARTYREYKNDLYDYIINSVDPKYGKHRFNEALYEKIQSISPEFDLKKPDELLIIRTSSHLFNYLVVDSPHSPNHLLFLDMISNMGTTKTIGLLLKIVLVCGKVKPYLERKFSILFNHYESFAKDRVPWLVKSLENLHIAFCVNYGKADFSLVKQFL
jgi:hypothetical protein